MFALLIVLGWLALTVITNVIVPQLEKVGEAHTVSMNAKDAPSMMAMKQIGSNFKEFELRQHRDDRPRGRASRSAPTPTTSTTS